MIEEMTPIPTRESTYRSCSGCGSELAQDHHSVWLTVPVQSAPNTVSEWTNRFCAWDCLAGWINKAR
jgi:hypothetical protein